MSREPAGREFAGRESAGRGAEGPADIQDMRIVHSALRRDLERTRIVLSDAATTLTDRRRRAIGEHLLWLMHTLHRHHTGEDEHVWPEIRRREPSAGPLLDEMDTDHRRIAEPIREIEQVAASLVAGTIGASEVLACLARLEDAVLPHLAREEREMMPVVAQVLSRSEWKKLGHRAFLKGKPLSDLALEGHWVIDHATPADRQRMVTELPALPRFILLHLLGGRYARRAKALWDDTPAAALPPLSAEAREGRRR
ncbi:MAG: hemerythrin domain-containing protein [Streptosporangiales bacterium]|nr:hemerythrin domain-containing protein [Streptosporangiales bacterium]